MSDTSDYERERQATIARNRELLAQLGLSDAASAIKSTKSAKNVAKPVQPRIKKPKAPAVPTRQSTRLRKSTVDPNEGPAAKRKRERAEEVLRRKLEQERLETVEREREAKRPRHHDLDFTTLGGEISPRELSHLKATFGEVLKIPRPKGTSGDDAYVFDDDKKEELEVKALKEKFSKLKVVARAKVTQDRIYSAAYHPEPTKDLIFFGDKHGQMGIWDARATAEDDSLVPDEDQEGGKYYRLQLHWPATSKSSISCIKFDPIDAFSIYTSAYDQTIRSLSLASGISTEIYTSEDALISSIDLPPFGHEMWISDSMGGLTHMDLRAHRSHAKRYQLSEQKIGSVSVNPTRTYFLVTASNSRELKVWDARMLETLSGRALRSAPNSPGPSTPRSPRSPSKGKAASAARNSAILPNEVDSESIQKLLATKRGESTVRGSWQHNKSVSSAYWDPRGRTVVSTSYDDTIRLWDMKPSWLDSDTSFPTSRPFSQIKHNCQTGKWLTILKAQWTPNPDVYPHFTIGNMDHSLDVFSCKGDHIVRLADKSKITAVQAVTCSHPNIVERVASGNASGRCVLWAPEDL